MSVILQVFGGAALVGGALLLVWLARTSEWTRLRHPGRLELAIFASRTKRAASAIVPEAGRQAEVKCAMCAFAPACAQRLAQGYDVPVEDCPNRHPVRG